MCEQSGSSAKSASLGVLFVHGMGTHPPGSTLRDFADPMIDLLMNGNVGVEAVQSTADVSTDGDPPQHLALVLEGVKRKQLKMAAAEEPAAAAPELDAAAPEPAAGTWLLAESCWSDSFVAPSYPRMAFWLIAAVPWMIGEYLRGALGRERERRTQPCVRRVRRVLIFLYALAGTLLSGPLIIVLALLVVARAIPIERVRKGVEAVARLLAASLGDVFIILSTHVDRAAIRARIVHDYAWLDARCTRTVVVAHSAGSALTHQLIRDRRLDGVHMYITLGEAIWRMRWMVSLSQQGWARMGAVGLAVAGTLGLLLGPIAVASAQHVPFFAKLSMPGLVAPIAVGVGLLLHTASAILVWKRAVTAEWRKDAITALQHKLLGGWRDYVASSDPVPAGALNETPQKSSPERRGSVGATPATSGYQAVGIHNRRSIARDHTSYVDNVEEFVAGVVADLARADDLEELVVSDRLATAAQARKLRTLSRALMRFSSATMGAIVVVALIAERHAFGEVGGHVGWVSDALKWLLGDDLGKHVNEGRTGVAVVFVMLVAGWLVAGVALRVWDAKDRKHFYENTRPSGATRWPAAVVWLVTTGASVLAAFTLAGVDAALSWGVAAVSLVLNALLISLVKPVARYRDDVYS
jgi:hypothetical protein